MKRLLREPLMHFLVLGGVLFLAYARWGGGEAGVSPGQQIVVSAAQTRHLAATFERAWQRPPTTDELTGLIEEHVREEIYCREAIRLGLDQDDTIIRRRLRQKVEFMAEDQFTPVPPSDAELQEFLEGNAAWFMQDAGFTFQHVYFNPERRGDSAATDAREALVSLRAAAPGLDAISLGDGFMLGHDFQAASLTFLARMFGGAFATELPELPVGSWQGPIESGYGLHLVRIESAQPGRLPELAEVRDAVLAEWTDRQRREAHEAYYELLQAHYEIVVESSGGLTNQPAADEGGNP
ncbi:MAG TPA: peptidylprolyl isomerase [Verrucomicrobiae bacterium]|nr:peptidylprolyl isomerase [Verrucomicrobiae bacterium]